MRAATIAVVDPLAAFRRGLRDAFSDHGYHVDDPDDVPVWVRLEGRRVLLITLDTASDVASLAEARRLAPGLVITALLPTPDARAYQAALMAGACSAAPRDAGTETIIDVVDRAVDHQALLPVDIAHALAQGGIPSAESSCLSASQVAWLNMIAQGLTVEQLAETVGYSRRQMFRELKRLYAQMSVDTQKQAVVRAAHWGLLQ